MVLNEFLYNQTEWVKYTTLSNYESFDCVKRKGTSANSARKLLSHIFIAIKNSCKLWVRAMLLWLQAEAVGREKPPAVLIFHAPGSASGSFLHLQGSAEGGIMKAVKLWSRWVWLHWGCWEHFPASDSHFPLDAAEPELHTVHPTPPAFYRKKTQVRGQRWSCGVPVLWPAAHRRAHRPHRQRHPGNPWHFDGPGHFTAHSKNWGLGMRARHAHPVIQTPTSAGRDAAWLMGSMPLANSTVSTKTYIRGHDLAPFSKFRQSSYKQLSSSHK